MNETVLVQKLPMEAPPPPAAPPFFFALAVVALALLVFRRHASAPVDARRLRMATSTNHPTGSGAEYLPTQDVDLLDATRPLAVFLVGGDHSIGPASLQIFSSHYSKEFPQMLFVSVGVMDYGVIDAGTEGMGTFQGTEEARRLKGKTRLALDPYLARAHELGLKADCRVSVATSAVDEIDVLSGDIAATYPQAVFFVSKLIFKKPRWFHRWLHAGTSDAIRQRLEKKGFPVTVLPVVLSA
jgi:hypothetical protein